MPRSRIPSAIDAFFLLRKQAGDLLKTLKSENPLLLLPPLNYRIRKYGLYLILISGTLGLTTSKRNGKTREENARGTESSLIKKS